MTQILHVRCVKALTLKGCKDLTSCTNYFLSTIFLCRRGMRQFVFLDMKQSFDCRKRFGLDALLRTLQLFWPENQSRQSRQVMSHRLHPSFTYSLWFCHHTFKNLNRTRTERLEATMKAQRCPQTSVLTSTFCNRLLKCYWQLRGDQRIHLQLYLIFSSELHCSACWEM